MKLLIILLLSSYIYATDFINIKLNSFVEMVSKTNNINIAIDEDIDKNISFYVSNDLDKKVYFEVLKSLLKNQNFYLHKYKNFYVVKKMKDPKEDIGPVEKYYFTVKLKYINYDDIKNFLKVYEKDVTYEYIESSKLLLINASKDKFESIKSIIDTVDKLPHQLKLKVTILETNLSNIKKYGAENQFKLTTDSDTGFFFNLLAFPFSITSDVGNTQTSKFYTFLRFIDENSLSDFISSPVLTLSDNKQVSFDVITNIPFSKGSTTIDEDNTKTTESIEYKDVGLKIELTPKIYNDNLVYIDLALEVSNVLQTTDNLPTTSKKYIKQSFYINTDSIFTLTGINQTEINNYTSSVPLLSDIPILGYLFKYEDKDINNTNLTILFELLNDDYKFNTNYYRWLNTLDDDIKKEYSTTNQNL